MFEAFIRSRIRRTLLARLTAQPEPRFYLRAMAKELGVSVGPLHKELHHLERLGLLTASLEANVRYYAVNQRCALFNELTSMFPRAQAPAPSPAAATPPVTDPLVQQRTDRVLHWGMRIGLVSLVFALGSGLVWGVSYLRRMERALQAFEGVLAEVLLQTGDTGGDAKDGVGADPRHGPYDIMTRAE